MDNHSFKSKCEQIDSMSLKDLKKELRSLKKQEQDSFQDDNMAGDIAITLWITQIKNRIIEIKKKNND